MALTYHLDVSFGQIAVFASTLQQPFNEWTDQHVSQGFSWRPGSVSFRTMVVAGQHTIEVVVAKKLDNVHPEAVRAVEVPFEVPGDGALEIGSIAETASVSLPAGSFLLRCEFMQSACTAGERVRLTFARDEPLRFAVVRADSELHANAELLTTAQPAP